MMKKMSLAISLLLALLGAQAPYSSAQLARSAKHEDRLECAVLPSIMQGFLSHHIMNRKLSPEIETRTIEQFIKRLDPSKVYLLESDVQQMKTQLTGIFKRLGEDCSAVEKTHQILINRLEENAQFAKEFLGPNFKFAENTELQIDPQNRKWSSNAEAAKKEMAKYIHFQISNYLASDMKMPQAKKQLIHRYELNHKRQVELTRDELYSLFLDSFSNSLDAHSNYLSKDSLDDFEIQMRLSLEGIGAALTWDDGYTTVESLIPGGSAEKSGLVEPKDKIIAVAQGSGAFEQVIDMPLRDVVRLIRGKKGTTVRLTVMRQGPSETLRTIVSLVRDKISLQDEAAKLLYTKVKQGTRDLKVAILDLPSFYGDLSHRTRSCYDDVKKLVQQAKKEKADGLILDLSKNGGGLLSEAVRIAGLFINKGPVVATQDSNMRIDVLKDDEAGIEFNGPIVVLTSRLSASASEIVSGALKDYQRAVIVGADHTFGKGTVQAMMNLPADFGAIKVTTGMFYIPGGRSTQHGGVDADVILPSVFSTKEIGEKSLDHSLPAGKIAAFKSSDANGKEGENHFSPVTPELVKKLQTASVERVNKEPEFAKIKKEVEDMDKKKGVIKLSDSLKKQKEANAEEKTKLAKNKKRGKRKTDEEYLKQPHVKEAAAVLADMIQLSAPTQVSGIAAQGTDVQPN